MSAKDLLTPWGVRVGGFPIIVWAADERKAVSLAVEWADVPVPVVGVDEVERSYPEYEEVLVRWRQRGQVPKTSRV